MDTDVSHEVEKRLDSLEERIAALEPAVEGARQDDEEEESDVEGETE